MLELPQAPHNLPAVSGVRGTVILSSLYALRALGHFEAYRRLLPENVAVEVLGALPTGWLPIELAAAHYRACEALELAPATQIEVGKVAGKHACGAMLGTAVRLSRFVGATPWTLMMGGDRIWKRAYEGGGLRILRLEERVAQIEVYRNPLFRELGFSRASFCGFCIALYGLVSQDMTFREGRVGPERVEFRVTWR